MDGFTRRDELRIEVGAMCAEVECLERAWRETRDELQIDGSCLAMADRLGAVRRKLAVLQASLDR